MADVSPSTQPAVRLVLGDEELLVARAVADSVAAVRAADPDSELRQYQAGELAVGEIAEMLSPSLFGGRRVLVVRDGQDAKKDVAAALLAYAADPEPDVNLIVTHAGGGKGKALADGFRSAGVDIVPAGRISKHRERVEFVRNEIRRQGGKIGEEAAEALLAAVGNDLRELVAACSQLRWPDRRADRRTLLPGTRGGDWLYGRRCGDGGRRAGRAGGVAVGAAHRRGSGADR